MSLTGRTLPVLLLLLVVVALAAVFLLWSRVRGPRWAQRSQRFGLLLLNQVAAVALVGVLANDAGDFFSSWSDLFGSGGGSSAVYAVGGNNSTPAPALHNVADSSFSTSATRAKRGELSTATITGAAAGMHATVHLYLPPQYFQSNQAQASFPVVEVLQNADGSVASSAAAATAKSYLQSLSSGASRPAALVMVDAMQGSCLSSANGPQPPMLLDTDLPMALTNHYRLQARGWGIMGSGEGGYCAARMALTEPNFYWAAASTNGYFSPPAAQDALPYQNDLLRRLRELPVPPARLLLQDTATADRTATQQAAAFRALVQSPLQVDVPTTKPADPAAAQDAALAWLTQHLPPAAG